MARDSRLDARFGRGRGRGSRITALFGAVVTWAALPNVALAQNGDSSGRLNSFSTTRRCAVELIGRNSVNPSTTPSIAEIR